MHIASSQLYFNIAINIVLPANLTIRYILLITYQLWILHYNMTYKLASLQWWWLSPPVRPPPKLRLLFRWSSMSLIVTTIQQQYIMGWLLCTISCIMYTYIPKGHFCMDCKSKKTLKFFIVMYLKAKIIKSHQELPGIMH